MRVHEERNYWPEKVKDFFRKSDFFKLNYYMMRKRVILAIGLSSILVGSILAVGAEGGERPEIRWPNPSFEAGLKPYWSNHFEQIKIDSNVASEGKQSLQITPLDEEVNVANFIRYRPHGKYHLEFDIKSDVGNQEGPFAQVAVMFMSTTTHKPMAFWVPAGEEAKAFAPFSAGSNWQRKVMEFVIPPKGSIGPEQWGMGDQDIASLIIYVRTTQGKAPGHLWLDNFALTFIPNISGSSDKVAIAEKAIAQEETEACSSFLAAPSLNPIQRLKSTSLNEVAIVRDGVAQAALVLPDNVLETDAVGHPLWRVARELRDLLKQVTGAEVKICSEKDAPAGTRLLLGPGGLFKTRAVNAELLPEQGFRVQSGADFVAISANPGDTQGLNNGVYDFAERFLGIRWYYPGEDGTVIPHFSTLVIPPVHYTDHPWMTFRRMFPVPPKDLAGHWRLGTSQTVQGPGKCHTWRGYTKVHSDHPECFELSRGIRALNYPPESGMPCYGNPKTLDLHIQDIMAFYDKGDKRPWTTTDSCVAPTDKVISFSPVDKPVQCTCDFCTPLMRQDGDYFGQASRLVGNFAANLARRIQAEYPDKLLFYLPYMNYTEPPEGVEFPDNVYVQLCVMDTTGRMRDPAVMNKYHPWLAGWKKLTGKPVYLWEYPCWPESYLPAQYPGVIQKFYRTNRDSVHGSFLNGGANPMFRAFSEWQAMHPTLYCWFRLMWNPDYNVDAFWEEYVRLMYGPAAGPMGDVLAMLRECGEDPARWPAKFNNSYAYASEGVYEYAMPPAMTQKLAATLAEARRQVGEGTVFRRRVDYLGAVVDMFVRSSDAYFRELPPLPTLSVPYVSVLPRVDGDLDEQAWRGQDAQPFVKAQKAPPLFDSNPPDNPTTVQAVWNTAGIEMAFRLIDQPGYQPKAIIKENQQSDIWNDDGIEIFMTLGESGLHFQAIVNTLGVYYTDLYKERDGKREHVASPTISAAASRNAGGCTIEVLIPAELNGQNLFSSGKITLRANFVRNGGGLQQRWSTRYRPSNFDQDAFGRLEFLNSSSNKK